MKPKRALTTKERRVHQYVVRQLMLASFLTLVLCGSLISHY